MINNQENERIKKFIRSPIKEGIYETIFEWKRENKIEQKMKEEGFLSFFKEFTPFMLLDIFEFLVHSQNRSYRKPKSLENIEDAFLYSLKDYFKIDFSFNFLGGGIEIDGEYIYIFQEPYWREGTYTNFFIVLSTSKESVRKLEKILESSETIVGKGKTKFIRSPQRKLFSPLFDMVNMVSNNIFTDWENIHYFNEAYNLYYQRRYDNSIAYIGKMTEFLLSTIYESLFQEYIPESFTLGRMIDKFQKEVQQNTQSKKQEAINIKEFREKVKNKNFENNEIKSILIEIINILEKEYKLIEKSLEVYPIKIKNEESIFPKSISKNLKKILDSRNAVSHNSGSFFNDYDSQKVLFYFLSVYNWWQEVYDKIDWEKDTQSLIKEFIALKEEG